jgi:hypothetical protein
VRDAGIVYENIETSLSRQFVEDFFCAGLIGNITRIGLRVRGRTLEFPGPWHWQLFRRDR